MSTVPPPANTAPQPEPVLDGRLEGLLAQLLDSNFVLTDPQGSVTKWNARAERMFGVSPEEVVGRSVFDALIEPSGAGDAWRDFLASGEGTSPPARMEGRARHASGDGFAVELTFVPVRLSEGFEFSAFLQDLNVSVPAGVKLVRLRRVHERVLASMEVALNDPAGYLEGARLAGALVTFRPLEETPWAEEEPEQRDGAPAAEPVAVAASAPRDAGQAVAERKALRDRTAEAVARIDALEREAADLRRQLAAAQAQAQETAAGADGARAEAEAAQAQAGAALGRLEEIEARTDLADSLGELREQLREADERAAAARGEAEAAHADAGHALARIEELATATEAGAAELEAAGQERAQQRVRLEEAEGRLGGVEARVGEAGARVEALESASEQAGARLEELRLSGEAERQALDSARGQAGEMGELLEQALSESRNAKTAAADARRELDETRRELGQTRLEDGASALTAFGVLEEAQSQAEERREQFEQLKREAEESRACLDQLVREAEEQLAAASREREDSEATRQSADGAAARLEEIGRHADESRAGAEEARAEAARAREEATEARDVLARLHGEAKEALSRAEEGRSDAQGAAGEVSAARGEVETLRALAGEALGELREARAAAEEARQSAEQARTSAERARTEAEEASRSAYELLGEASGASNGALPRVPTPESFLQDWQAAHPKPAPARELREGFDDCPEPMATIGLDGHFIELNTRFCEMVGYSEHEFRRTVWPSVVDREQLAEHRLLMEDMRAGELDESRWETSYVHEQGLLVYMAGQLALHRDDSGEPRHFLFTVDLDESSPD